MRDSALQTLENVLRSDEERREALKILTHYPDEAFNQALLKILHNKHEAIPFRRDAAETLKHTADIDTLRVLHDTLFDRHEKDYFVRDECLAILWDTMPASDKETFLSELLGLAQDTMESADVREYVIGYLQNANFIPEKEPDWASRILQDREEPVPVRTAALTYMETLQYKILIELMPALLIRAHEDRNFREILMLKASYLSHKDIHQVFRSILSNQHEPYWARHLALNLLQNDAGDKELAIFLLEIWKREKNGPMRDEIKLAREKLK
ncbi:MAG: hypothetical protein COV74_04215 [Candidatus Omnitrophica bacterium CG11_big_fil_rev_8_21_14_0_20_45_26]|uniref:HEAT repeat domain-containing protein n=1 Tax=Candidatus Abzuiibacterium crystallinum TaxID=1974748 RepID=A0A2H0LQ79_9BACT|nr:MAG: hypothetical protein COV74_04215 [Candidatus Omnitrophica bacterium CG11_big_fil_rev_8_21_14_0_20_45_26]PIW63983.1 MAG: hypothetical protein COW12_08765 [Candidatus Omnitrophica bacterium CG12_big_fil_rev_8_21_14_0_65_45_16]